MVSQLDTRDTWPTCYEKTVD